MQTRQGGRGRDKRRRKRKKRKEEYMEKLKKSRGDIWTGRGERKGKGKRNRICHSIICSEIISQFHMADMCLLPYMHQSETDLAAPRCCIPQPQPSNLYIYLDGCNFTTCKCISVSPCSCSITSQTIVCVSNDQIQTLYLTVQNAPFCKCNK